METIIIQIKSINLRNKTKRKLSRYGIKKFGPDLPKNEFLVVTMSRESSKIWMNPANTLKNMELFECNKVGVPEKILVKIFLILSRFNLDKPTTLYYKLPQNVYGMPVDVQIVSHREVAKLHPLIRLYINKQNPICPAKDFFEAAVNNLIQF